MITKLDPCSICGKAPSLRLADDECKYFCGAHNSCGDWFSSQERAAQDWNRRSASTVERVERAYSVKEVQQTICAIDAPDTLYCCEKCCYTWRKSMENDVPPRFCPGCGVEFIKGELE